MTGEFVVVDLAGQTLDYANGSPIIFTDLDEAKAARTEQYLRVIFKSQLRRYQMCGCLKSCHS